MRWVLALIATLMLAAVPAAMAAKKDMKDPPGKTALVKAGAKVNFKKEDAATHTYGKGGAATFVPCDIGSNKEEIEHGMIIGRLELTKNTKELGEGVYRVYMRKQGARWECYFCQDDRAVAQSDMVQGGLDTENRPKFVDAGTSIRYGWWKFSF